MKYSILRALRAPAAVFPRETEEPIRGELFGIERLEQHAESLAAAQRVTARPRTGRRLAGRLRDNGRVLHEAYSTIAKAVREERAITPAAEWLVDNFYVAQEQIREIRDDLPRGFYRGLPKLAEGFLEGYPRVFGIAWAFVAHTDSRFEPELLRRFVQAYQRVQPLTIGELWAVAITLRIVLVENLRRVAEQLVRVVEQRAGRPTPGRQIIAVGGREAEAPEVALRRFDQTPLPTAFAVELVQRLRDQDPSATPALAWLNERLAARGTTADADRPRGASETERDERDGAQRDHEHAPDIRRRLGGVLRERQPRRCRAARRQRLRRNGFPNPGSLPACDRGAGARLEQPELEVARRAIAAAKRAPAGPRGLGRRIRPPRAGARLLPHLERAAGAREGDRIPCSDERLADSRQCGRRDPRDM